MDIFITDASFDYKSKTSIIGIKNLSNGNEYQKIIKDARNPFEAEKAGIQEVIIISLKENLKNVLIYCDNKGSVIHMKKEFFNSPFKNKFNFIQFVWIPREFTHIADSISKEISNEDIKSELKDVKAENLNSKKDHFSSVYLKEHVNDLNPSSDISNNLLKKRISQFILLKDNIKFKSSLFSNIQKYNVEEMVEFIISEIELIEDDIELIEDDILKLISKSILDLLIIS